MRLPRWLRGGVRPWAEPALFFCGFVLAVLRRPTVCLGTPQVVGPSSAPMPRRSPRIQKLRHTLALGACVWLGGSMLSPSLYGATGDGTRRFDLPSGDA